MKKVKFLESKNKNKEITALCEKCKIATIHLIIYGYELKGSQVSNGYEYMWDAEHQIIQCRGCQSLSFRKTESNSEDMEIIDAEGNAEYAVYEKLYPPRELGIADLAEEKYLLPLKIGQIYNETLSALLNQSNILAGIGLRAIIEAVCKEKEAKGRNLVEKIDSLQKIGILTPSSTEILHRIRTLGNSAAHEVEPHNQEQLKLAMTIAEHLLREVYIIPALVKIRFK